MGTGAFIVARPGSEHARPGRLADALSVAEARLQALYRSVERRQLYDATAWHDMLAGIEAIVRPTSAIEPDLAGQLRDALGWLQTAMEARPCRLTLQRAAAPGGSARGAEGADPRWRKPRTAYPQCRTRTW
jgi:hypothetical protein